MKNITNSFIIMTLITTFFVSAMEIEMLNPAEQKSIALHQAIEKRNLDAVKILLQNFSPTDEQEIFANHGATLCNYAHEISKVTPQLWKKRLLTTSFATIQIGASLAWLANIFFEPNPCKNLDTQLTLESVIVASNVTVGTYLFKKTIENSDGLMLQKKSKKIYKLIQDKAHAYREQNIGSDLITISLDD